MIESKTQKNLSLIRNIIFNQSTEYYDDELILEQMLAAANMSQPPPETWRAIVNLLTRGLNVTHLQYHLLNNKQNDTKQQQHQSLNRHLNSFEDKPKSRKILGIASKARQASTSSSNYDDTDEFE